MAGSGAMRGFGHCRRGRGYPPGMPSSHRPDAPHIVVLGDLVLDVILAPLAPLQRGTDVSGRVAFVQGGSAANTARWLGRLGARTTLVCAVGRDATGRALVDALRRDGVTVRASRIAGARTARIGVIVSPDGERSFVPDRRAAELLDAADLKPGWFVGAKALHLPVYSLLGGPLGEAGRRAIALGRGAGALVSVDLASIGPLMAGGRSAAQSLIATIAPEILFATATETDALLDGGRVEGLLEFASIAVVKRGSKGVTVLARAGAEPLRLEVATAPLKAADTTGAGDAFDAGFLVGWLTARGARRSLPDSLQRAAAAGHRAATRQLSAPRPELRLG